MVRKSTSGQMKNLLTALAFAALLFGCVALPSSPSSPAQTCAGRFDERLNKCVEYSDSVFSSAAQYSGKYVCLWGTLASQKLLTMPSVSGGPRVSIHLAWGANTPPPIGECTSALANICGTFSSASGGQYYQLLDAQSIGLDTELCIDTPPAPPGEIQGGGTDTPPAPPQQNTTANSPRREIQGGGTSPPSNPPSQPASDAPPSPPS